MRIIICLLAFLSLSCIANAQEDTVGFWQLTYNGKEIRPVMMNSESTYLLDSIADSARINIFYYTESPCKKCPCKLQIRDENSKDLKTIQRRGYGDNAPFPFKGYEIKQMMAEKKIYLYFTGKYDGWMPWIFLGALRKKT